MRLRSQHCRGPSERVEKQLKDLNDKMEKKKVEVRCSARLF